MGFYLPQKQQKKIDSSITESTEPTETLASDLETSLKLDSHDLNDNSSFSEDLNDSKLTEEEEDNMGWITPGNLAEVKKHSKLTGEEVEIEDSQIRVGCMTSDFSMQVGVFSILFSSFVYDSVF